jgi:hypothetical protein
MKVSIERIPTVLLATLLIAGCTVNIQTTPKMEPNPPVEEDEADGPLVSPTDNPERREQPVRRDTTDRSDPTRRPVRRVPDAVITRREEPPPQSQDSVTVEPEDDKAKDPGRRSDQENRGKKNDAKGAEDDPPDRPGVGNGRDASKEEYPGAGNANGLTKQEEKGEQGDARRRDRQVADESPGRGNAKGLEKQAEAEPQPATSNDRHAGKSPNERAVNGQSRSDEARPEGKPQAPNATQPRPDDANGGTEESTKAATPGKRTDAPQPASARQPGSDQPQGVRRASVNAGGPERGANVQRQPAPEPPGPEPEAAEAGKSGGNRPVVPSEAGAENEAIAQGSSLGISTKELPAPGKCRVWIPGRDAGDQPKAGKCEVVEAAAPPGSWVLYRSPKERNVVQVRVMDHTHSGIVSDVLSYDIASGKLIGENQL